MQEIKKYVGLYLLAYMVVLLFCGVAQYVLICQMSAKGCAFNLAGVNTIITTTAYVLTPLIAIIGFLSWKSQYNKVTVSQLAKEIYGQTDKLNMMAYRYGSLITTAQNSEEQNSIRTELLLEMNRIYDEIRLLSKLTNNANLEKLNEGSRDDLFAMALHVDMQINENVDKSVIKADQQSNYEKCGKNTIKIRNELSNYIIV